MATLLENWRNLAYGDGLNDKKREDLWKNYFAIEKGIYEKILSNPTEAVEGTVKELAEKYETDILIMTGFLDGINESLKGYENPIETMDEDTADPFGGDKHGALKEAEGIRDGTPGRTQDLPQRSLPLRKRKEV